MPFRLLHCDGYLHGLLRHGSIAAEMYRKDFSIKQNKYTLYDKDENIHSVAYLHRARDPLKKGQTGNFEGRNNTFHTIIRGVVSIN